MTSFTVNGVTYNDGEVAPNNLGNGGFRSYWAPMINDALTDFSGKVTLADAAATAALVTANALPWSAGMYAADANAISQIDHQTYRNVAAGARNIDPASDPVNWVRLGGVGNHEIAVHTGNGFGSTNTRIRRYTTAVVNTGTAITYADSATLGSSFTINEPGLFSIYTSDSTANPNIFLGVSLNSSQLSTDIYSVAVADRLIYSVSVAASTTFAQSASRTVRLSAGDVVRPHPSSSNSGTSNGTYFSIRKVGV